MGKALEQIFQLDAQWKFYRPSYRWYGENMKFKNKKSLKLITSLFATCLFLIGTVNTASANTTTCKTDRWGETTCRDSSGKKVSTSKTDRWGDTTIRDSSGKKVGTSKTDRWGDTTIRDSSGKKVTDCKTDRWGETKCRNK
jgi:hypothetical protein